MPPRSRWRHPLRAVATAALALLPALPAAASLPAEQVTVVAILAGPDPWIDRRRARRKNHTQAPALLATEPAGRSWPCAAARPAA